MLNPLFALAYFSIKCFRKSSRPSVPQRGDSLNKIEVRENGNNGKKVGDYVIPKSEIIPIKLRSRDQVINK